MYSLSKRMNTPQINILQSAAAQTNFGPVVWQKMIKQPKKWRREHRLTTLAHIVKRFHFLGAVSMAVSQLTHIFVSNGAVTGCIILFPAQSFLLTSAYFPWLH